MCIRDSITPELTEILESQGFDLTLPYAESDLYRYALMDKKISGDKINMVVPDSLGKCHLQKISLDELKDFIKLGL